MLPFWHLSKTNVTCSAYVPSSACEAEKRDVYPSFCCTVSMVRGWGGGVIAKRSSEARTIQQRSEKTDRKEILRARSEFQVPHCSWNVKYFDRIKTAKQSDFLRMSVKSSEMSWNCYFYRNITVVLTAGVAFCKGTSKPSVVLCVGGGVGTPGASLEPTERHRICTRKKKTQRVGAAVM